MTNKWYLFATDGYGDNYMYSYDSLEELEKCLNENYDPDTEYTIVCDREHKHQSTIKVVVE